MGHARFFIDAKPKRRHRYLFANKKTFTTISDEPGGKRTTTNVEAASRAEALALYEAGCRQALAEGGRTSRSTAGRAPSARGHSGPRRSRPSDASRR